MLALKPDMAKVLIGCAWGEGQQLPSRTSIDGERVRTEPGA